MLLASAQTRSHAFHLNITRNYRGNPDCEISFELRGRNPVQTGQLNPLFHTFGHLVNRRCSTYKFSAIE